MRRHLVISLAFAIGAFTIVPARAHASPARTPRARQIAAPDSSLVGTYGFSFVPRNGEQVTGEFTVTSNGENYRAVFKSPKLDEPEDADFVRVRGTHVEIGVLGGSFVFRFDNGPNGIRDASFTKVANGATETGTLSLKRIKG